MKLNTHLLRLIFVLPIRAYRKFVSPLIPPRCRFTPTCSEYTLEAVLRHGIVKGTWFGLKRVSKCHPFHAGGFDPVPPRATSERAKQLEN